MSEEQKIKYYNSGNQLASVNLKEGAEWSKYKTSNKNLNNIFDEVDDGDGIVSADEIKYLRNKLADKNNNGIFDNNELSAAYKDIFMGKGDGLAQTLKNDVNAKKFYMPTTGKDFGVHILDINRYNVTKVLEDYQKLEKRSLFAAIMTEYGLDFDKRANYCRYVFKQLSADVNPDILAPYKAEFEAELARQKKKMGFADADKLDEIVQKFQNDLDNKRTDNIAINLHNDVSEKKYGVVPTTGKNIGEHVSQITEKNVDVVLDQYKTNYKQSLFTAIMHETGLDFEVRANYCRQIFNQALKKAGNTPQTQAIKQEFEAEITKQKNKTGLADGARLEFITKKLLGMDPDEISVGINNTGLNKPDKELSKEDLEYFIGQINGDNVTSVLYGYEYIKVNKAVINNIADTLNIIIPDDNKLKRVLYGATSLMANIMNEDCLNFETKERYCRHIFNALIQSSGHEIYTKDLIDDFNKEMVHQKNAKFKDETFHLDMIINNLINRIELCAEGQENFSPNGKIDKDFCQGGVGDCYVLSSIKSISLSDKGLKLLNDSIKLNADGSVTVTLKGVNKSYTYTREEIEGHTELASGDLDVRAIEMAINQYHKEKRDMGYIDNGGNMASVYKILTGKSASYSPTHFGDKITQNQIDRFNNKNYVITVGSLPVLRENSIYDVDADDDTERIVPNHAYTVKRADNDYVYLINPWDTANEIKVDIKTFNKFFYFTVEMEL